MAMGIDYYSYPPHVSGNLMAYFINLKISRFSKRNIDNNIYVVIDTKNNLPSV